MKDFKTEFETKLDEAAKPNFEIELEDGNMQVYTEQIESKGDIASFKISIKYNGLKTSYISNSDYETSAEKGDGYEILNNIIQNLFMDGVVKTK